MKDGVTQQVYGSTRVLAGMVVAALFFAACPLPTSGQETEAQEESESQEGSGGLIDKGHAGASHAVRGLGERLDRFFGDEHYVAEVNKSRLRLRADNFAEFYAKPQANGTARLHLILPAVSERFRFEILSPGEVDDFDNASAETAAPPEPSDSTDKPSAVFSYFVHAVKERSIIARLGMDFEGYKPDPFVGLRYRELAAIGENWDFRFIQGVRFYSIDGLESRTTFEFDRGLEQDTLFRFSVDGTWLQQDPAYFYSTGISLSRPLHERAAIEFRVVGDFKTHPHRLDQITVGFRHRQKIWREWLSFEISPQARFPDARNFEAVPGIMVGLEATFGG